MAEHLDQQQWAQWEAAVTTPPPGWATTSQHDEGDFFRFQQAIAREVSTG